MKKIPIFVRIFLVALLVRIFYSIAVPTVFFNVDSYGYYTLGTGMVAHPTVQTIFGPYRTPLYPLFIQAIFFLSGFGNTPFGSEQFILGIQIVAMVQMIIGALAFTVCFMTLRSICSPKTHLLLQMILIFDVFVIGWERTLLTEGLAISLLLFITSLLVRLFDTPTIGKFVIVFFLFVLSFLLRPAFILVPLFTLPIIGWYFRKPKTHDLTVGALENFSSRDLKYSRSDNRSIMVRGKRIAIVLLTAVTLSVYMLIPLAYASINYRNYQYFGIQYVGDIDILGRILETKTPVNSAKNYPYFYNRVMDYQTRGGNPHPFRFLEYYDPDIYSKPYRFTELQGFNRTVLIHTFPFFIKNALINIPTVLLEVCDFTRVAWDQNIMTRIVWTMQQFYGKLQYTTLVVPPLWILSLLLFFKKPSKWNALVVCIGSIAVGQILLTAAVVYKDTDGQYGRALSVVRPQMTVFLLMCMITMISFVKRHKLSV